MSVKHRAPEMSGEDTRVRVQEGERHHKEQEYQKT